MKRDVVFEIALSFLHFFHQGGPSFSLVKMLGQKWAEMSDEDKKPFQEEEKRLRAQYHVDVQNYKKGWCILTYLFRTWNTCKFIIIFYNAVTPSILYIFKRSCA